MTAQVLSEDPGMGLVYQVRRAWGRNRATSVQGTGDRRYARVLSSKFTEGYY